MIDYYWKVLVKCSNQWQSVFCLIDWFSVSWENQMVSVKLNHNIHLCSKTNFPEYWPVILDLFFLQGTLSVIFQVVQQAWSFLQSFSHLQSQRQFPARFLFNSDPWRVHYSLYGVFEVFRTGWLVLQQKAFIRFCDLVVALVYVIPKIWEVGLTSVSVGDPLIKPHKMAATLSNLQCKGFRFLTAMYCTVCRYMD